MEIAVQIGKIVICLIVIISVFWILEAALDLQDMEIAVRIGQIVICLIVIIFVVGIIFEKGKK